MMDEEKIEEYAKCILQYLPNKKTQDQEELWFEGAMVLARIFALGKIPQRSRPNFYPETHRGRSKQRQGLKDILFILRKNQHFQFLLSCLDCKNYLGGWLPYSTIPYNDGRLRRADSWSPSELRCKITSASLNNAKLKINPARHVCSSFFFAKTDRQDKMRIRHSKLEKIIDNAKQQIQKWETELSTIKQKLEKGEE